MDVFNHKESLTNKLLASILNARRYPASSYTKMNRKLCTLITTLENPVDVFQGTLYRNILQ